MKKGKIALIGTVVILSVITFLFVNNSLKNEGITKSHINPEIKLENESNQKDVEEVSTLLYQKDGLFEQVGNKLEEKNYAFQTLVAIYSKDDIQVKYILENREATESVQEEVKSVFYEQVKNNNLNSNSFNLKIADSSDGPDW